MALGAVGGARRTESSVERLRAASRAAHVYVEGLVPESAVLAAVRALPEVDEANAHRIVLGHPSRDHDVIVTDPQLIVAVDDGASIDRGRLIEGRLPRPFAPDEVIITEAASSRFGVDAGETMTLFVQSPAQAAAAAAGRAPAGLPGELEVSVVGVERSYAEAVGQTRSWSVRAGPAFWARHADSLASFGGTIAVVLRDGSTKGVAAFRVAVSDALGRDPGSFEVRSAGGETAAIERTAGVTSTALVAIAGVASVAGGIVLLLAIERRLVPVVSQHASHSVLGMGRGQRATTRFFALAPAIVVGAAASSAVAVATSPLFPLGRLARVEPQPGVSVDTLVLGAGSVVVAAVVSVAVLVAEGQRSESERARPAARVLTALPPAARVGVGLAVVPPVASRSAVRVGWAGAVLGVAGLTAAFSLGHRAAEFVSTPGIDGWNWTIEASLGSGATGADARSAGRAVAADPSTSATSILWFGRHQVGDESLPIVAVEHVEDHVDLSVVRGRVPSTAAEIAVGARTADQLDASLGDTVRLTPSSRPRVVGVVRFPETAPGAPNEGALATTELFELLDVDVERRSVVAQVIGSDSGLAALRLPALSLYQPSADARDAAELRDLTPVVATAFGIVLVGAFMHSIGGAPRRHAGDLAALSVLGFTRRQIASLALWQAAATLLTTVPAGVVLGLVVGRVAWTRIATEIGIRDSLGLTSAWATATVVAVAAAAGVGLAAAHMSWTSTRAPVQARVGEGLSAHAGG